MALPGFELMFSSVSQQLRNPDDASIVALHWYLISNGFKCCGTGEEWSSDQKGNFVGSEVLPVGWNGDPTLYCLRYVETASNRTFLMKSLAIDGNLNLNFMRCHDEKIASLTFKSRDFINEDRSSCTSAYSDLAALNSRLKTELVGKVVGPPPSGQSSSQAAPQRPSAPAIHNPPERSPLMVDPPRQPGGLPGMGGVGYIPPRRPTLPGMHDPFAVGRADLDPLGGPGGGMFMDPRGFPAPPGAHPAMPRGFPPGAVPPGARFDPIGPPGMRPNPDPDHEAPPNNYDDMFM